MATFHVEILKILNSKQVQIPVLVDEVSLERNFNSSASTLNFTCNKYLSTSERDDDLSFSPGDYVLFILDGLTVFRGRVFKKSRSADHKIQVTAYDNIRYLMNQDTIILGQDADGKRYYTPLELFSKIEKIFKEQYSYSIPFFVNPKKKSILQTVRLDPIVYEDKSYMDMILDTFNQVKTKKNYDLAIYDAGGQIFVRFLDELVINWSHWVDPDYGDLEDIRKNSDEDFKFQSLREKLYGMQGFRQFWIENALTIDQFEDFSHEESIDEDVYTAVKLAVDATDPKAKIYIQKSEGQYIYQYGPLVHYEKIESSNDFKKRADSILSEKSSPKNTFSISGCRGNISVRGGTGLFVFDIDVGHTRYNGLMLVKEVTHHFKGKTHTMDLKLTTHPQFSNIKRVD